MYESFQGNPKEKDQIAVLPEAGTGRHYIRLLQANPACFQIK